ncbi:MAG: ATP-binding protein, partial [Cyanobacteria bacterium P01_H01_bin.130]
VLASMRVGSHRIQEIVKSLKNFSRLDEATFKAADIHQGIDNTLMILHHRWSGKAGRAQVEIVKRYGEVPMVECCPGQLNQVFMNLLSNAIDALDDVRQDPEDGGKGAAKEDRDSLTIVITTTYQPSTHTVQVAIADNGSGISPANQRKLFDPFFTTKPVGRGTGLGLAISHEVITKQHGGTIEVSSVLGEGTTFTVTLPVQAKKPMV